MLTVIFLKVDLEVEGLVTSTPLVAEVVTPAALAVHQRAIPAAADVF